MAMKQFSPMINMPSRFRKMNSMPDDPPFSKAYGYETEKAACFVMTYPIPNRGAMPYGDPQTVIDEIHQALGKDQGLICVGSGKSGSGHRFIYSIVKTYRETGVQYCLTMHLEYPDHTMHVQGFFDEAGTTGYREAMVFAKLEKEGKIGQPGTEGSAWAEDPYDPEYHYGTLMNRSEMKEYDALFPEHPLSEARRFVSELTAIN